MLLFLLRRHHHHPWGKCVIDLRRGVLQLGSAGKEVPFLTEKDLPARARGHHAEMDQDGDVKMAEGMYYYLYTNK